MGSELGGRFTDRLTAAEALLSSAPWHTDID